MSSKHTQAIYRYEAKQLFRSKAFILLTALVFLIGLYAILYGKNEVKEQNHKIALLENNIDSLTASLADTLKLHDVTASEVGDLIGRLHANRPSGMAALAFGQRDIHKFAQQITNGSFFYHKYATGYVNKTMSGEILNPFKLLAGHLDIAFVLLLIFPLYAILLGYNVLSADKEGGTLSLLGVQPVAVREIIFHKLLFRFTIIVVIGLLLLTIAGAVNNILSNTEWWLFAATFIAYMICWMGIMAFIISFKKGSGFNALALVSTWLLFTMLLPALLNAILNNIKPIPTHTALAAAVQKANAEIFALPKEEKVASFKQQRPYYANAFDTIGKWEDPKFFRVTYFLVDKSILPYEEKRIQYVAERNIFADRLNYFSPTLLAQQTFNELGGSNMQQMLAYDTSSYSYFKQISRFTDDLIFLKGNQFNQTDLKNFPLLIFNPVMNTGKIAISIIVLLVTGLALAWISFGRLSGHLN